MPGEGDEDQLEVGVPRPGLSGQHRPAWKSVVPKEAFLYIIFPLLRTEGEFT